MLDVRNYVLDTKIKTAIERIKFANDVRHSLYQTPFYVAYSGGKDSDVVRLLMEEAGVPYELWYSHTTVDAPETVRYIDSIKPKVNKIIPKLNMWQLIEKNGTPPSRMMRYCCVELKEVGGKGRFVVTGVRWAESAKRKKRGSLEIVTPNIKDKVVLNADNTKDRRMLEKCVTKGKHVLNPIVDWSDADIWIYLKRKGCASNPLYSQGFNRIGCIGCPLANKKQRAEQFRRYPKYKDAYMRAFAAMIKKRIADGREFKDNSWKTAEDVMKWYLNQ